VKVGTVEHEGNGGAPKVWVDRDQRAGWKAALTHNYPTEGAYAEELAVGFMEEQEADMLT